jgi:hypothetical protein
MSINIIGKEYFQSKKSINRLKTDLKSADIVDVGKDYLKYLKDGYMFNICKFDNNIKVEVVNIKENEKKIKNKKFFELKIKELKEKRLSENSQKNIFEKAKVKYKIDEEIIKLYYELKKYVDKPILNPMDAYNNKEQYIPIVEELCSVFKSEIPNPYSKYYNMLLSSLV